MQQGRTQRPSYTWNVTSTGIDSDTMTVTVTVTMPDASANNVTIVSATAWTSFNNELRDWREHFCASPTCENFNNTFYNIDIKESEQIVMIGGRNVHIFNYTIPSYALDYGYSAFYIELELSLFNVNNIGAQQEFVSSMMVTSDMKIVPEVMPYGECPINVCACGWSCGAENSSSGDGDSSKVALIVILSVIGAVVVLAVVLAGGAYFYLQRQKRQGYVVL